MQAELRIICSVHAVQSMTPTDDFFTSRNEYRKCNQKWKTRK